MFGNITFFFLFLIFTNERNKRFENCQIPFCEEVENFFLIIIFYYIFYNFAHRRLISIETKMEFYF